MRAARRLIAQLAGLSSDPENKVAASSIEVETLNGVETLKANADAALARIQARRGGQNPGGDPEADFEAVCAWNAHCRAADPEGFTYGMGLEEPSPAGLEGVSSDGRRLRITVPRSAGLHRR